MLLDMDSPLVQIPMSFVSGISSILSILLLILIIIRSRQVFGSYKILLFAYTLTGFCSSFSIFVTLPVVHSTSNGIFVFNTVERFPEGLAIVFLMVYVVAYIVWALVLTLSFIYRCLVIRNRVYLVFNRPGLSLILLCSAAIIFTFVMIDLGLCGPQSNYNFLAERIQNITGKDINTTAIIGGIFYNPDNTFGKGFYQCISHIGFIFICIFIMIYCTVNFYNWYAEKAPERFSEATKLQQRRFIQLLLLQTITPLCCTFSPAVIMVALTALGTELPRGVDHLLSVMLTLPQLMDPIWILMYVRDYKDTLLYRYEANVKQKKSGEFGYAMKELNTVRRR